MRTLQDQLSDVRVKPASGTVKWFDPKKGYGFVTTAAGDVLLHAKVLRDSGFAPTVEPGMYIECHVEHQEKGTRAIQVVVVRPDIPIEKRMELQNAEFDACDELAKQWRRIQMTPVVDDDYPEVRHEYEGALRTFLKACKANGRTL